MRVKEPFNNLVITHFPEFSRSEFAEKTLGEACIWMQCDCEGAKLSNSQMEEAILSKYQGKSINYMINEFEFWYGMLWK